MSIYSEFPTSEILQDIADTKAEIVKMRAEEPALRELGRLGDRMALFRADARVHWINEREVFIAKLEGILAARKEPASEKGDGK